MYSVRERLLRIYEEAAGEPYQSDVASLQAQDAGIKQEDAEIIENLRIVSQLRINDIRKALEERDSMIRKNPSNTKIPLLSQEIREKIRSLREHRDQFQELEKRCRRGASAGSADARAQAQQNCKECADMASLLDEYCSAFTEEERERAFKNIESSPSGASSVPFFGASNAGNVSNGVVKSSKLDELLPVHANAEEAKDKLASMEKEFNEDLKILMGAVSRAKVQVHQIGDKLGQMGEVIETVEEKVNTAVEDVQNLNKSTADVRKKVANVGKCIWIAIIIILLAIVGIWLYRIIQRFT